MPYLVQFHLRVLMATSTGYCLVLLHIYVADDTRSVYHKDVSPGLISWMDFMEDDVALQVFRFVFQYWFNVGVKYSKLCAFSNCLVLVLTWQKLAESSFFSMSHDVLIILLKEIKSFCRLLRCCWFWCCQFLWVDFHRFCFIGINVEASALGCCFLVGSFMLRVLKTIRKSADVIGEVKNF